LAFILWKKDEEYIGIIGVVEENSVAEVRHITVVPSYRGEGIARKMIEELSSTGQFKELNANETTKPLIIKCLPIVEEADDSE